jgi:hypothetical protein
LWVNDALGIRSTVCLSCQVGILEPAKELAKLERKHAEVAARRDVITKRVSLPGYAVKTPEEVRADDALKAARCAKP